MEAIHDSGFPYRGFRDFCGQYLSSDFFVSWVPSKSIRAVSTGHPSSSGSSDSIVSGISATDPFFFHEEERVCSFDGVFSLGFP